MTSKRHVSLDELQALLDSLAAGTIASPNLLPGGLTPGGGGIPATPPTNGLFDAFNRNDSGNGTLGTTDFGALAYTYESGKTPSWVIGLDHRAKMAPGGAAAFLNAQNVNQHPRFTINSTNTTEGVAFTIRLRDTATGGAHYRIEFGYGLTYSFRTYYHVQYVDAAGAVTLIVGDTGVDINLFDGADHLVEVDINVFDIVVMVDRVALGIITDTNQYDSSGTCFGFSQSVALLLWDNISILPQIMYDDLYGGAPSQGNQSVAAQARYAQLNTGNIGTARFPGGYGAYISNLGSNIGDLYGNGIEGFLGGPGATGGVMDLGAKYDLEAVVYYSAQTQMSPTVYLRYVDANNYLRVIARVSFNSGGTVAVEVCVAGVTTILAANGGGVNVNGRFKGFLINGVVTGICPSNSSGGVHLLSYALQSGDVPDAILNSHKVGVGAADGTNYSALSAFTIIPL